MTNPKLRPVEAHWIDHRGQPALLLRDPLHLSDQTLLVPPALATLLALCDGTRSPASLRAAFTLRSGIDISPAQLDMLIGQLDEALLLVSPRFDEALANALASYRSAAYRPPALAGRGYPADPIALRQHLDGFVAATFDGRERPPSDHSVAGVISPHIDYERGGPLYASAWLPLAAAVRSAEIIIILGTDHSGGPGELTLTRQHYATPFGVLPTDQPTVDAVSAAIGETDAFASELHHRHEHSIELAAVWLHYLLGENPCPVVPILCGSFQLFTERQSDPGNHPPFAKAIQALRSATAGRRAIVVAAADLAHVGPAFGDQTPLDLPDRATLKSADNALLAAAITGDAEEFFATILAERDRRRICGLPPIYLMLRLLQDVRGEVVGYAQCPADEDGGSLVSIGAVVYRSLP